MNSPTTIIYSKTLEPLAVVILSQEILTTLQRNGWAWVVPVPKCRYKPYAHHTQEGVTTLQWEEQEHLLETRLSLRALWVSCERGQTFMVYIDEDDAARAAKLLLHLPMGALGNQQEGFDRAFGKGYATYVLRRLTENNT